MVFRFNNLTVARFVAALLVFFHHSTAAEYAYVETPFVARWISNGYVGVSFFFIVSGFVLAASNLGKLEIFSLKGSLAFYWKRIARIVPLMLVVASPLIYKAYVDGDIHLWNFLTLTQAWSGDVYVALAVLAVAWTLSVEMFFYLMFPFVAAALRYAKWKWSGLVLVCIGMVIPLTGFLYFQLSPERLALPLTDPGSTHYLLYRLPIARFGEFLAGIGIYLMIANKCIRWAPKPSMAVLAISIGLLLTFMCLLPMGGACWVFPNVIFLVGIVAMLAHVETLGLSVRHKIPLLLGESSFALYLVHQYYIKNLMSPTILALVPMPAALAFQLLFAISVSIGFFLVVETPLRDLFLRLVKVKSTMPSAQVDEPVPENVRPATSLN